MKFQDLTEIGERGTTLSGGQKARLSLARALYQQADLYLFDDPLSAVDASVAKNIFHMAIKEFIFEYQIQRNPTKKKPIVILVTHQVQYAVECDKIGILNDGELIAQGSYEDIKSNLYMINEELAQQLDKTKESVKQDFIRPQFQKRAKIINFDSNNLISKEADQQSLITLKTYARYYKFWNLIVIVCILSLEVGSEVLINFYQRIISLFEEYQKDNDIQFLNKNFLERRYIINIFQKHRDYENILIHFINFITFFILYIPSNISSVQPLQTMHFIFQEYSLQDFFLLIQ